MFDLSRVLGRLFAAADDRPVWRRYLAAAAVPGLAAAFVFFTFGFERPFFPPFGLAVAIVALYAGMYPGLAAVAVCLFLNAILLPPRPSLGVAGPRELVQILIFGLSGSVFAVLIGVSGKLQRKLDLERQRLAVSLSSIGDAVISTDAQGCVTFMNAVAESVTGWKLEEARGLGLHHVFRIINEETRNQAPNPVDRVLATGCIVGLANHTLLIRKDGTEVPIDDSAAPIRDGQELAGVILVFRDISQAKALQVAMVQSEKLATVGRLAATIAHEINNPLESLTNLLYLIGSSDDLSVIRRFAETAERELARAAHVTKQALSFARQSELRSNSDIAGVVQEVLAMNENRLRAKNIAVDARVASGLRLWASAGELRQLLSNLIINSVDALQHGGHLQIRATLLPFRNAVSLVVADTGLGITDEAKKKLFQPFFTTKRDVGTGLGLWVCRQIVESHGGTIRFRSRAGKGTVFVVTLPNEAEAESRASA